MKAFQLISANKCELFLANNNIKFKQRINA